MNKLSLLVSALEARRVFLLREFYASLSYNPSHKKNKMGPNTRIEQELIDFVLLWNWTSL